MKNYPKVKVAAVQAAPILLDLDATVDKVCRIVDEAASNGAKIIGFPEAFVPGYPWWIWMGAADYGMKYYIRLYKNAVEIPSPAVRRFSDAARRNEVYLCVSVTEKDGGSLYLTQLWFGPKGDLLGKHRKFKATNAEKTIWGDGDGSMAPLIESEYGNLGGLQCWEHMIPMNIAAMGALNEQIHVASWPIGMPGNEHLFRDEACVIASRYYAMSNQCFVILGSQLWNEQHEQTVCETPEQRAVMEYGHGCACVIAPNGAILASVPHDQEGIAYAECDLEAMIPGKFLIDTAGHYSTPGFLSMTFDRREHRPVFVVGEGKDTSMSYDEIQYGDLETK